MLGAGERSTLNRCRYRAHLRASSGNAMLSIRRREAVKVFARQAAKPPLGAPLRGVGCTICGHYFSARGATHARTQALRQNGTESRLERKRPLCLSSMVI